MNSLDKQYMDLLHAINEYGVVKQDRTGTGTKSIFGYTIRHNMQEGFPLLTTKKMYFKGIVTELLWFLRGDTNIKYLVDNDCHIWDGDAYKRYKTSNPDLLANDEMYETKDKPTKTYRFFTQEEFINKIKTDDEFAKKWGELGPVYGKQWRSWSKPDVQLGKQILLGKIDQIQNLINDLKTNPDSRRLMVNAWNVGELDQMVLPPCHYGFQVYTRELEYNEREKLALQDSTIRELCEIHGPMTPKGWDEYNVPTRAISLMWNQRSVDTFLGLPFNIASYGLLLEIIAKAVNMIPDELIGNLGDVHLYSNHIEQAKEQIGRKYTPEERQNLLMMAMGIDAYNNAVAELMPFGGGMSTHYDFYKIPHRTREPFDLPKLRMNPIFLANLEHKGLDEALNGQVNFELENYQSHPAIKAPLNN